MALQKQAVSVPFAGGVDAKTDAIIVDQSKLLALENYAHNKRGTLARRDAWVALTGANLTGLDTQAEVFAHGRELLAIDSSATLKTYAADATAKMPSRGAVPNCSVRKDRIFRTGGFEDYVDSATSNGLTCFVWRGGTKSGGVTGIYCSVIDESTGAIVVDNLTVVASVYAMPPRVCAAGGYFVFVWGESTSVLIASASMLVGATALAYGAGTVAADPHTSYRYEISPTPDGSNIVLVYTSSTATYSVSGCIFDPTGAAVRVEAALITDAQLAKGATTCVALTRFDPTGGATDMVLVVGTTGTAVKTVAFTCSATNFLIVQALNSATVDAAASDIGVVATSPASVSVFSSPTGNPGTGLFNDSTFTVSPVNYISGVTTWRKSIKVTGASFGPYLWAKPFAYGGAAFIPVVVGSPLQPTLFILDALGNVVARALDGVNGGVSANGYLPSVTVSTDGKVFSIPAVELGMLSVYGGKQTTQQGVSRIRLAMGRTYSTADQQFSPLHHAEAGGEAYLSGGFLAAYDGAQVVEAGFHWYPESITAVASATGGNPNGVYHVCALYEWVDGRGRRHQSTPSLPKSVTAPSKKIDMTCPTLQLGVRKTTATIAFYRTLASGTTFYRDSPATTPIVNSLTASTVSYTSDVTDATLAANEILYSPTNDNTAGAELFHDPPPACRAICAHQGRVFIAGLEDEYEFRYSQQPVARQGLNWSNSLSGRIPEGHGGIVAMGVLDDKLVLYTPTRKFAMVGEGPNLAGALSTYTTPQLIPGDVGCVDQRSLALVPDVATPDVGSRPGGLIFQSRHGLYLTERSLGDQYVGYPVEPQVLASSVTSAVTLENEAQLRITLASGLVLAYDYLYGQWSTYTNAAGAYPRSACVWNNLWTFADSQTGGVVQELVDNFRDLARAPIVGRISTAWFKPGAIDGFQRIWRMFLQGLFRGDARIDVTVHVNYDSTTVADAFTIVSTATSYGSVERQIEARFLLASQKCTAIQFDITDTPLSSPWKGTEFSGITLEVGVKPGTSKRAPMAANSIPAPTGAMDFSKPGDSYAAALIGKGT